MAKGEGGEEGGAVRIGCPEKRERREGGVAGREKRREKKKHAARVDGMLLRYCGKSFSVWEKRFTSTLFFFFRAYAYALYAPLPSRFSA